MNMYHFHCTVVLFGSKCFIFIALSCFLCLGPTGSRAQAPGPRWPTVLGLCSDWAEGPSRSQP